MALRVGLEEGTEVDLDVENGHLVVKLKSATLNELLDKVTLENLHKEILTGEPRGGSYGDYYVTCRVAFICKVPEDSAFH
jgi:antitoxin MazE